MQKLGPRTKLIEKSSVGVGWPSCVARLYEEYVKMYSRGLPISLMVKVNV